jgi:hypothetical protein
MNTGTSSNSIFKVRAITVSIAKKVPLLIGGMLGFYAFAATLVWSVSSAKAEPSMAPIEVAKHIFKHADINADGVLSKSEYEKAGLAKFGSSLEAFDADSDGRVLLNEYLQVFEKFHPSRAEKDA